MVHQHFKLVDVFTAIDNIILGEDMPRYSMHEHAAEFKAEANAPHYVIDNDDSEAPVKTVRQTDTAFGRFKLAVKTAFLPAIKFAKRQNSTGCRVNADKQYSMSPKSTASKSI